MKTAVSIPDRLFRQADAFARRFKKTRSQVYAEALGEYLAKREPEAVTAALDDVAAELDPGVDPWVGQAGRMALERSEW